MRLRDMIMYKKSLLPMALAAITSTGAFAQMAGLVAVDVPEKAISPIAVAKADAEGRMVGGWHTLNPFGHPGGPEVPSWVIAADTMNVDLTTGNHTSTVYRNPAPPAASLWSIGSGTRYYNMPFISNDQSVNPAAQGRAGGQLFIRWLFNPSGVLPLDASVSAQCIMFVRCLTSTGDNSTGVAGGNGEALSGLFLNFGTTASGAYVLSGLANPVLGQGFSIPLPWTESGKGAVQVAIGTLDGSGNFVQAPGQAAYRWGSPCTPTDTVLPGTNPSDTDGNNWNDQTRPSSYQDASAITAANPGFNQPDFTLSTIAGLGGGTPVPAGGEYTNWFSTTRGNLSPQYGIAYDANETWMSGTVTLNDLADPSAQTFKSLPVDIVAVDASGTPLLDGSGAVIADSASIASSTTGQFHILNPYLQDQFLNPVTKYVISFKKTHWLRANSGVIDISAGSVSGITLNLINGDVDGDNEVAPNDFSVLSSAFGNVLGDPGYNANADLDEDGEVGPSDYSILASSFGLAGDDDLTP